jgi:hypothetical protein
MISLRVGAGRASASRVASISRLMLVASMFASPVALAADEPPRGFYVGAGVGSATLELEDTNSYADFKADDTGVRAIAGYRFFEYLAVELNYADYGVQEDRVLGLDLEGDFHALHLAAVGLMPLGVVDLFGKLGVAAWEGELRLARFDGGVSEDNLDPVVGLGAQARFGRLAIRGEIEGLMLGFDDDGDDEADGDDFINFASVSVTWTF